MSLAPVNPLPYCGAAPLPGELLTRFNLDPRLAVVLVALAGWQWWRCRRARGREGGRSTAGGLALAGWGVAAAALMSPLCALSVSLFSARIAQHMVLVLIAAPLIAYELPVQRPGRGWPVWASALVFFASLWFWHMPLPYEATFSSVTWYWCMHLCLFGGAIWLWRELLHPARRLVAVSLIAGALTSMQMGMLGAFIALASHPLYRWHLVTTAPWGMTPLEDQQLGGALMWVPGIALFLWVAVRSVARVWASLEGARLHE
jgi:putative membrane protein